MIYEAAHNEANECIRQNFSGHTNSWRELHSADIVQRWPRDTSTYHTLLAYVACTDGGGNEYLYDAIDLSTVPYGGRPDATYRIASIQELRLGDTGTIVLTSESATGIGTSTSTVKMGVGAFSNGGAVTKLFDVTWGKNVPLGTCNATSCPNGCCLNNVCYPGSAKSACGGPYGGYPPGSACSACRYSCCGGVCGPTQCP